MAQITGATSGIGLDVHGASKAALALLVDTLGNPLIVQQGANAAAKSSGLLIAGVNDGANRVLRLDRYGNTRPGFDNLQFEDSCEGTTINTQIWSAATATMTQAQTAAGGIQFNAGASVAAGVYATLQSQKQFIKTGKSPLMCRSRMKFNPSSANVAEWGFGVPTAATAQLPVGAVWRYTASGAMTPVLVYNGNDVLSGSDVSSLLTATNYYTYDIIVDDDNVLFVVQDVSTGRSISEQTLQIPSSQARMWSVTHLPFFIRQYTTSAPGTAASLYVSDVQVIGFDSFVNKPFAHQMATIGHSGEYSQTTFAQTANLTNSAAEASATLSNTAAGYTTLGGLFAFVAPAGAATDFVLFGFQVPAPYSFYATGVHISSYNDGAPVATTATLLRWALANNSSAVSLAGTINRSTLGIQSFPVGAAVGAAGADLDVPFEVPFRTDAGRFLQIIVRVPIGTATASQVIRGSVLIRGYFD